MDRAIARIALARNNGGRAGRDGFGAGQSGPPDQSGQATDGGASSEIGTSQHLVDRGSKLAVSPQRPQRIQSLTGEERVGFCAVQTPSSYPIPVFSVLSVVEKLASNVLDRSPQEPG